MQTQNISGFEALNVSPALCKRLSYLNITVPTPIQEQAIPIAADGDDLIGIAQTGTGKTLAFALPMAPRLYEGETALVLAPTRELAQQIAETYKKLDIACVLVVGGASMGLQVRQLRGRYSVIIATPGRLMDHMQQGTVRLNRMSIVVLDEADRMLDMGFAPAIKRILDTTPLDRQTLLFSATMPREIADLAANYLRNPKRVEVSSSGTVPDLVEQELCYVEYENKQPLLRELLYEEKGTILVFARTRHGARKLAKAVREDGHTAAELHADRTLAQRRQALQGFKSGEYRVLVATDIAARGIDVKDICLVINYDVPEKAEDYIHRIGRTGRAGAEGRAITIAIPSQVKDVNDIERLLGTELTLSDRSMAAPKVNRPTHSAPGQGRRRSGSAPAAPRFKKPSNVARPHRENSAPAKLDQPRRLFSDKAPEQRPAEPKRDAPRTDSAQRGGRFVPAAKPAGKPGHRGWSGKSGRRSGR